MATTVYEREISLAASYMYLLRVLIGSLASLHLLVGVISLVLVLRHSIENRSKKVYYLERKLGTPLGTLSFFCATVHVFSWVFLFSHWSSAVSNVVCTCLLMSVFVFSLVKCRLKCGLYMSSHECFCFLIGQVPSQMWSVHVFSWVFLFSHWSSAVSNVVLIILRGILRHFHGHKVRFEYGHFTLFHSKQVCI